MLLQVVINILIKKFLTLKIHRFLILYPEAEYSSNDINKNQISEKLFDSYKKLKFMRVE